MARQRSPNIDKAFNIYKEHDGNITNREIAKILGEDEKKIAVWKQRYKWKDSNVVQQRNESCTTNNTRVTKAAMNKNISRNTKGSRANNKTNTHSSKARYGNKNAVGNKGGPGGPLRNKKAEKHGFYSKYLPEDTFDIFQEIDNMDPLDMLWSSIKIQYSVIVRSQKIMYVKDQEDLTKILKKEKESTGVASDGWEKEYEIQTALDKQATVLQAQSRAMAELRSLIKQYEDILHANWDLATEEQKARIAKLKADIDINNSNSNKQNALADAVLKKMSKRNGAGDG